MLSRAKNASNKVKPHQIFNELTVDDATAAGRLWRHPQPAVSHVIAHDKYLSRNEAVSTPIDRFYVSAEWHLTMHQTNGLSDKQWVMPGFHHSVAVLPFPLHKFRKNYVSAVRTTLLTWKKLLRHCRWHLPLCRNCHSVAIGSNPIFCRSAVDGQPISVLVSSSLCIRKDVFSISILTRNGNGCYGKEERQRYNGTSQGHNGCIREVFCFVHSAQFSNGYFWRFMWWFYWHLVTLSAICLFCFIFNFMYQCLCIQHLLPNIINECGMWNGMWIGRTEQRNGNGTTATEWNQVLALVVCQPLAISRILVNFLTVPTELCILGHFRFSTSDQIISSYHIMTSGHSTVIPISKISRQNWSYKHAWTQLRS